MPQNSLRPNPTATSSTTAPLVNDPEFDPNPVSGRTRRDFLATSGKAALGATLLPALARPGYAAGSDTIQVALIGCGGRGTGAAANALATKAGPTKLVAMADVFEDKLSRSHEALKSAATRQQGRDTC